MAKHLRLNCKAPDAMVAITHDDELAVLFDEVGASRELSIRAYLF
jgi:hypothetical protein